jgi:transposase-like protein
LETVKFYCRGNPKFTQDEKQEMIDMKFRDNKRLREIAAKFDCSIAIVHRYVQQHKKNI